MARAHHVKKARKDNPKHGIKKGDEYWWAGFKTGPRSSMKRYWKKKPRPSQLTQSEFYSAVYSLQEEMEDAKPADLEELESLQSEWAGSAREIEDDCRSKFDNMPEGLQQGDTGQLLEERAEAMENWASEIEGVDCSFDPGECTPEEEEELKRDRLEEVIQEFLAIDPGI